MRSLILAAALAATSLPALAQGLPGLPGGMPQGLPQGMPQGMQPGMPDRPAPRPLPPLPTQQQDRQAEAGSTAPMPAQPPGGFTLPTGGAAPGGPNLSGAPGYARTLQEDGTRRLSEMGAGVVGNGAGAPAATRLDAAPISNQADLEAITNGQRNIVVLKQKVEEAKLAVELWHVLYNNEDAKALREKEEKVAEAKAKDDKETKEKEAKLQAQAQAQAATVNAGSALATAMRTADPAPPKVVEVNGSRALLLVPGNGEVWVRSGTTVAGGWRVTGVAPKSVSVVGPKGKMVLGYGDSIAGPPMAPPMPVAPARPPFSPAPRI